MAKPKQRYVEFDALNYRSKRDIKGYGGALGMGDHPRLWRFETVITHVTKDGQRVQDKAFFRPSDKMMVTQIAEFMTAELRKTELDNPPESVLVRAFILK